MKSWVYFCGVLLAADCVLGLKSNKEFITSSKLQLQMVNVVFRHGDRVPEKFRGEMYPNDPNIHNTFFPMGYGGLTNRGKLRAYTLGQTLRCRYNTFLGKIYLPEDISARSTNFDRTKMTLLLVLAGLYPPDLSQKWHPSLDWQPIPTDYQESPMDTLLMPTGCSRFKAMEAEIRQLPEVVKKLKHFRTLYKRLTNLSGKNITSCKLVFRLYNTLISEREMNLTIPKWADNILNNRELEEAVSFQVQLKNYNATLRKLNGGVLLRKMTNDIVALKNNETLKAGKKINLYSAHDINVAAHLLALGVTKPHNPYYASAVILELYSDSENNYYVQVLYYKGDKEKLYIMQIPNCSSGADHQTCTFEEYEKLMKNVIPSDDELQCT